MDANAAVDAVYRSDWGRIVATLIRLVGDFDLAEESAQEAFAAAVDQWPVSGVAKRVTDASGCQQQCFGNWLPRSAPSVELW